MTLFGKLWCTFHAFIPRTVNNPHIQMKTVSHEWTMLGPKPTTLCGGFLRMLNAIGLDNHLCPAPARSLSCSFDPIVLLPTWDGFLAGQAGLWVNELE